MTMPGQHSHEHTHKVVDGNGHPVHDDENHEHPHADGPTPTASRHHDYVEEPRVVLGPITPGQWQCATDEASGKPYVYVTRDSDSREIIAQVVALSDSGGKDRALANAQLMTFSPALLRFVQNLASYQGGSGHTAGEIKDRALALIEQLNEVEVRNDADRW